MKREIVNKIIELCSKPLDVDIKKVAKKYDIKASEDAFVFFGGRKDLKPK